MKREIKFRAMDARVPEDSVHWVYGAYVKHLPYTPAPIGTLKVPDSDYEYAIVNDAFSDWQMPRNLQIISIRPNTVGQYVGRKDKNKREIYEGDIVRTGKDDIGDPEPMIGQVIMRDGSWLIENEKKQEAIDLFSEITSREVIGNIYENPELLEKTR